MSENLTMPTILQSIQPQWCELIASGKKTIEVRKTKPKIPTPFKVLIYCTKQGRPLVYGSPVPSYVEENLVQTYGYSREEAERIFGCWNGKVIGEYECDEITKYPYGPYNDGEHLLPFGDLEKTCLDGIELYNYLRVSDGYGWHISNLKIYDKPKELNEFFVIDNEAVNQCEYRNKCYINPDLTNGGWLNGTYSCSYNGEHEFCTKCKVKPLTRPPQSWCYVEENITSPFVDACLNGQASLNELDKYVEYWHTHDTGNSLREFLGLTLSEYEQWGKSSDSIFEDIIQIRRKENNSSETKPDVFYNSQFAVILKSDNSRRELVELYKDDLLALKSEIDCILSNFGN